MREICRQVFCKTIFDITPMPSIHTQHQQEQPERSNILPNLQASPATTMIPHIPGWNFWPPSPFIVSSHSSLIDLFSLLYPWSEGAGTHQAHCWCLSSLSLQCHNCTNCLWVALWSKSRDLGELPCEPSSVATISKNAKG